MCAIIENTQNMSVYSPCDDDCELPETLDDDGPSLSQNSYDDDDDIPLSNLVQNKTDDEDDVPLSHLLENKTDDEDDIPLSRMRQGKDNNNKEQGIPLIYLGRTKVNNDGQEITDQDTTVETLETDDGPDGDTTHSLLTQSLPIDDEVLPENQSDSDEYIPSPRDMKNAAFPSSGSSSEAECDENPTPLPPREVSDPVQRTTWLNTSLQKDF